MATQAPQVIDIRKQFQAAGFTVTDVGQSLDTIEVKKNNCLWRLERDRNRRWVPEGPPCLQVRGLNCELEDRGFQKFWYHEGKRFPVRRADLETLHGFEEEVRYIIGLKRLYHLSLGSTSARTVYDRLTGRPDR